MNVIYILTQNVKLESLTKYKGLSGPGDVSVFVSTNFLFENERAYLTGLFGSCVFKTFADYLSDEEMQAIDVRSYRLDMRQDDYIAEIKKRKNRLVRQKVLEEFPSDKKYVLSKCLGVDCKVWKSAGFRYLECAYYSPEDLPPAQRIKLALYNNRTVRKLYYSLKKKNGTPLSVEEDELRVGYYKGKKYIFLGKLSRIDYRLDIPLEKSPEDVEKINAGVFEPKDRCTYVMTWHEHFKYALPDDENLAVRWAQDGYLPPNYTHYDYEFKPSNVVYYCWDELGTTLFKNRNLPCEIIPFRKKLYLPEPVMPETIRNVLIVASGSGDWTALKNRSDDDIMVYAFAQMAKRFPDVHFTYRCHPTWVHPSNVGVNAVNRVHDYFESLALPNLTLSSNTPLQKDTRNFQLSFSRSSLDEDLKLADFVFGEHSISMVDAAFKGVPFCSVNLTGRRNFFVGMNDLGFPSCTSHEEIAEMITNAAGDAFRQSYLEAVRKYNEMTDREEQVTTGS